jgi:hypothetical protein
VREIDVVLEVRLTSIDIQSDFEKGLGEKNAVDPPIDAFHKAQIGVSEEAAVGFITLVADAVALNADAAVEAEEVRDLVRLISQKGRDLRIGAAHPQREGRLAGWQKECGSRHSLAAAFRVQPASQQYSQMLGRSPEGS